MIRGCHHVGISASDLERPGRVLDVRLRGRRPTRSIVTSRRCIASFSPTAIRVAKRLLNAIEDMPLQEGYTFEQRYTVRLSGHPDAKEALQAFAERRAGDFLPLDRNETAIA